MKKILSLLCFFALTLFGENPFEKAGQYYNQGKFEEALATYYQVEGNSAALDYNKANTLMRLDRTNEAIAYYRRALWQKSGDPDIRANLQKAQERSGVERTPLPILRRMAGILSTRTWQRTLLTMCWFLAAWGLLSQWLKPLRDLNLWVYPLFISALALSALGTWSTLPSHFEKEAIIGSETVTARFEPLSDATEHFSVPGGTLVSVLNQNRNWARIQVGDKNGWVAEDELFFLRDLN